MSLKNIELEDIKLSGIQSNTSKVNIGLAEYSNRYQRPVDSLFRFSGISLVTCVWLSALLFGLYILSFYATALYQGQMSLWNEHLLGLYQQEKPAATTGIGIHFIAGGIILILGCIQLMPRVRNNYPKFHRLTGRVYISACILTAIGGLIFILVSGTIGGVVMDIGFALYGVLMLIMAIQTLRYAMTRNIKVHQAWALRLFALAIGSWLYRMDYGFWLLLADGLGHNKSFDGPFDHFMAFFFYLPNLLIAEIFIRSNQQKEQQRQNGQQQDLTSAWLKISASLVLLSASCFILIGTYYFTLYYWGPAILNWFIN